MYLNKDYMARNIFLKKPLAMLSLLAASLTVTAQSYVTYNHDDAKMNQITVQEIGSGGLTPAFYYDVFHRSYQRSAAAKNKLGFRTLAGVVAYQQITDAEQVDSALTKRAKIEALNIADRSGGALDVAWLAEGSKLTSKMQDFQSNINRIIGAGGTFQEKERWTEYYNVYHCAIQATQDAYMPNAQRKKQYLRIYEDVSRQNETLIAYLIQLNSRQKTAELLSATNERISHKAAFATQAHNRWREAAWKAVSHNDE